MWHYFSRKWRLMDWSFSLLRVACYIGITSDTVENVFRKRPLCYLTGAIRLSTATSACLLLADFSPQDHRAVAKRYSSTYFAELVSSRVQSSPVLTAEAWNRGQMLSWASNTRLYDAFKVCYITKFFSTTRVKKFLCFFDHWNDCETRQHSK